MQPSKRITKSTFQENTKETTSPKRIGVSLVEVVVAVALSCILLLWTTVAYSNISKNSVSLNDISTASILAEGQVEYLKTLDYTSLSSITNGSSVTAFSSNPAYGYKYTNVSSVSNSSSHLMTLTVNVYKMSNTATPIFTMDASFLRGISNGNDIGI